MKVAITIDLHTSDYPYEIEYCLEYLAKENLPATFFIPTRMLENRLYREAFLKLKTSSHELATHSHHHNDKEINALKNGGIKDLAFLSLSKGIFENFFQCSPHTFRSPSWCSLSRMTLEYLHKLGYSVDSSATPQRLGIFSSFPAENKWLLSKRKLYFIYKNILEIPTSCFLFPLASPTFRTFRLYGTLPFLSIFMTEANLKDNVINVQFHPGDFCPYGEDYRNITKRWTDLIPRPRGGIMAKMWLRERKRKKIFDISTAVIDRLRAGSFQTLAAIRAEHQGFSGYAVPGEVKYEKV